MLADQEFCKKGIFMSPIGAEMNVYLTTLLTDDPRRAIWENENMKKLCIGKQNSGVKLSLP
jgi:hypothetical protein